MWDLVRQLITTRVPQLVARYAAIGLVALASKLSVNLDTTNVQATSQVVGALVVAALLLIVDHFSHGKQHKEE